MAKARVIIKRRKAVRNIRKITNVMQKIATARYVKALRRATGTKPYVQKITELVASIAETVRSGGGDVTHPLLQPREAGVGRVAVLVVTSNRGLAGGYNGGILRIANQTIRDLEAVGHTVDLHVSGKKGLAFFRFARRATAGTYTHISDQPKYADVEVLAQSFIDQYTSGQIDGLKVVYQKFLSAGQQRPTAMDVLPLTSLPKAAGAAKTQTAVYDFSPSPEALLNELIPAAVKIMIFQAFIDAAVSEQIARMIAMKAATDNAGDMIKMLTREYNRARQAQITKELAELMGGVEALK